MDLRPSVMSVQHLVGTSAASNVVSQCQTRRTAYNYAIKLMAYDANGDDIRAAVAVRIPEEGLRLFHYYSQVARALLHLYMTTCQLVQKVRHRLKHAERYFAIRPKLCETNNKGILRASRTACCMLAAAMED